MRNWWQRFRRRRKWQEENQEEEAVKPRFEYNRQLAAKKRKEKEQEYVYVQMQTRETEARAFLEEEREEHARKALIAWEKLQREKSVLTEEVKQLDKELEALLVLIEREEVFSKKDDAERNLVDSQPVEEQMQLSHETPGRAAVEEKLAHMKREERRK